MAAYMPFNQTISALQGTGRALTGLAALGAQRNAAESTHALNMAKLGTQRAQVEGQNKLGLAQLDAGIADRAENRAWREKEFGAQGEVRTRQLKTMDDAEKDRVRRMEEGTVGSFWEKSLSSSGVPEEQRARTIAMGRKVLGPLWDFNTTRGQAEDMVMREIPQYLQEEARAQRAANKSGGALIATEWEFNKKYVAPIVENFTGDPQSEAGKGIKAQARTAGSVAYAWQEPVVDNGVPVVDEKGNPVVRNKWYSVPARVAYEANTQMFWGDIVESAPRAAALPYEQKNALMAEVANNPERRGEILNKYGVGIAVNPEVGGRTSTGAAQSFAQPKQPTPSPASTGMNVRTYNPDTAAVRSELAQPFIGLGNALRATYDYSRRPVNPQTGVPYPLGR